MAENTTDNLISFADGQMKFHAEHHGLIIDDQFKYVPDKQYSVLKPLAESIDQTVSIDSLIDYMQPGLHIDSDRYKQRTKVDATIRALRRNFNKWIDGVGDPETGALRNDRGFGYYLCSQLEPLQ